MAVRPSVEEVRDEFRQIDNEIVPGYEIAQQFGVKLVPVRPGLVPFTWSPADREPLKQVSGLAVRCAVVDRLHGAPQHEKRCGETIRLLCLWMEERRAPPAPPSSKALRGLAGSRPVPTGRRPNRCAAPAPPGRAAQTPWSWRSWPDESARDGSGPAAACHPPAARRCAAMSAGGIWPSGPSWHRGCGTRPSRPSPVDERPCGHHESRRECRGPLPADRARPGAGEDTERLCRR